VTLMLAALAGDLLSKHAVFAALLNDPSLPQRIDGLRMHHGREDLPPQQVLAELHLYRQIAPGLRFTLSTNPGVVFGTPMFWPLVSGATIVTIVLVAAFFALSPARAYWTHVALAWIAAGALGNLYDRLLAQVRVADLEPIRHQVRDFIDCSQIGYRWIFNLADAYLVVGVLMLILHWLSDGRRAAKARAAR
jgi:lipoprotein signal peptidase